MQKQRPKYLNLIKIRLPLPGFVSILHRVSGALLFFMVPIILWLLAGSLSSEHTFEHYRQLIAYPWVKGLLLLLLWAFLHHMFAGIRFLGLDIHYGATLPAARFTAKGVLLISMGLTVLIGGILW